MKLYYFYLDNNYVVNAIITPDETRGRFLISMELELEELPDFLDVMTQCVEGTLLQLNSQANQRSN